MPKILSIIFLFSLAVPFFVTAEIGPPETLEAGKQMIEEGGKKVLETGPEKIREIWRNETLPVWDRMWSMVKAAWNKYVKQKLSDFWYNNLKLKIRSLINKIKGFFGQKVEEREDVFKEEFQKEKEELQEELPKASKSLWQRFKELFK